MSFLGHQFDHNFDTRNVLSVTYASSKLGYLLGNTLVPGCTNEDLHLRPISSKGRTIYAVGKEWLVTLTGIARSSCNFCWESNI